MPNDKQVPQVSLAPMATGNERLKAKVDRVTRKAKRDSDRIPRDFIRNALLIRWFEQAEDVIEATKLSPREVQALMFSAGAMLCPRAGGGYDVNAARAVFDEVATEFAETGVPPIRVRRR